MTCLQTEIGRYQGGKGTGLGLALVRRIVKLSGGRLGVKSKVRHIARVDWYQTDIHLPYSFSKAVPSGLNCHWEWEIARYMPSLQRAVAGMSQYAHVPFSLLSIETSQWAVHQKKTVQELRLLIYPQHLISLIAQSWNNVGYIAVLVKL